MSTIKVNTSGITELDFPTGVSSATIAGGIATINLESSSGIVIGFIINDGSSGTNVGPMLVAPLAGSVTKCVIVTKASDASTDLTIQILQNGTDVFSADPTVTHSTSSGTVNTFTSLTSNPLSVSAGDVFSINITSGTTDWQFTAQLE